VHSNKYVFLYTLVLTTVVAVVLAFLATSLKPMQLKNEALFKKKDILSAIDPKMAELPDDEVEETFASIKQLVIDSEGNLVDGVKAEKIDMAKEEKKPKAERIYPLYVYDNNGEDYYITSMRGNGLWDKIWGSVALQNDLRTIVGVTFDHTGETPGLGAEIKDNSDFKKNFIGDKIYNDETGEYLNVRKGGQRDDPQYAQYEVDGISGATVTADGVTAMIRNGMGPYLEYFYKIKE